MQSLLQRKSDLGNNLVKRSVNWFLAETYLVTKVPIATFCEQNNNLSLYVYYVHVGMD